MSLKSYFSTVKLLHQHRLFERFFPVRLSSTKTPDDFSSGSLQHEGSDDQSGKMRGWQIHEYGGVEILQCSNNIKIPTITSPNEVCIEVYTASVNPIDVAMMGKMCIFFNNMTFLFLFFLMKCGRWLWFNTIECFALQHKH